MAKQEYSNLLKQGVEVWNSWRTAHPDIQPDLSGASLFGANLRQANLAYTNLREVDLTRADLVGADLRYAILTSANLREVDLTRADLVGADLRRALLTSANLCGAILRNADLSEAYTGFTVFVNNDLRTVKGLETIHHAEPSSIGTDTISRSEGHIPEMFLRGAGVSESIITYARSLVDKPIEYYTCFISYSSKDEEFAKRLYTDLQSKGVRCWFSADRIKIGDSIIPSVDEAIHLYDKLILILSEHSIESSWVQHEVKAALDKEKRLHQIVLFPIRLDKLVMTSSIKWIKRLRDTRHIADFEQWNLSDKYRIAVSRLIRDLQVSVTLEANEADGGIYK